MEKNNPKTVNAWCMYDWANSTYNLTITTAIFPIYFSAITPENVDFFWLSKKNSVVYTYSVSLAFLIIAFLSPFLSGIADYSDRKKTFMQAFVLLGSLSCMSLFFFDENHISLGVFFFITASIGYAGSLVFYNAYLPEIATPDQFDRISAKGYSLGYIGSVILLIINLVVISFYASFGLANEGEASRWAFLCVGVWWFGFSLYTFKHLPKPAPEASDHTQSVLLSGFQELKKVFGEVRENSTLTRFLLAFFFYSMGFQTIMYLASIFGSEELKLPSNNLIGVVLVIQLVAILGAMLFTRLAKRIGNLPTLTAAVGLCILICVAAYFTYTEVQFYLLAVLVGLIMGGIQSMSRSTYAKLLPPTTDHASYFSFYEFTEKTGIVLGTATFGLLDDITPSMRNSLFALAFYFVLGLIFLFRTMAVRKPMLV